MENIRKRLPENLSNQISNFLGTDVLVTVGDREKVQVEMKVGVPEGSPLSLSIFNLYIDKLAYRLDEVVQQIANIPATIYADDVVIFAKSAKGL